jgi:hypothetical protein
VKHVISIDLPELDESHAARKASIASIEPHFANQLFDISEKFPSSFFIMLGTSSSQLRKRQHRVDGSIAPKPTKPGPKRSSGGILKKYQLLTPGLITSLLVVFGVLLPFLLVGISALANIKAPMRMEAPKGIRLDKKNQ